jgi:hypothetical protein
VLKRKKQILLITRDKEIIMKSLILFTSVLAMTNSAFAGFGKCNPENRHFTCSSIYKLNNNTTVNGATDTFTIRDIQTDISEPAQCIGSVALNTPVGKFVANYWQDGSWMSAWIDTDVDEVSIVNRAPISKTQNYNVEFSSNGQDDVKSVIFNCEIK